MHVEPEMIPKELCRTRLRQSADVKLAAARDEVLLDLLESCVKVMIQCIRDGGTIFFCGNGGSATDAEHLSAEFLGHFAYDRPSISSVCLSSNVAGMSAIANDYSYQDVFSRHLAAVGRPGDVLVTLSTSGNSANVVAAVRQANLMGVRTVALTGSGGGALASVAEFVFRAPTADTPRVQECCMTVGHTLCEIVEAEIHPR
jgi:D-sedoheptulose 7-phosphate isomerase